MKDKSEEHFLDSEEFYNLMQAYRLAPLTPQSDVIKAFEDVKEFIIKNIGVRDAKKNNS